MSVRGRGKGGGEGQERISMFCMVCVLAFMCFRKPSATENTIASLRKAGAHGADYVEFDLQLTKDLVPVVYHDFTVCTTLARVGLP